jgi:hypothetical protein
MHSRCCPRKTPQARVHQLSSTTYDCAYTHNKKSIITLVYFVRMSANMCSFRDVFAYTTVVIRQHIKKYFYSLRDSDVVAMHM